jgi:hypothetical protein
MSSRSMTSSNHAIVVAKKKTQGMTLDSRIFNFHAIPNIFTQLN